MAEKIQMDFNTALTDLPKDTGIYDEEEHRKAVLPLRGKIMQLDGATGCCIGRYGLNVNFFPRATDAKKVEAHVRECLAWAWNNGFFPLRGEKELELFLEK